MSTWRIKDECNLFKHLPLWLNFLRCKFWLLYRHKTYLVVLCWLFQIAVVMCVLGVVLLAVQKCINYPDDRLEPITKILCIICINSMTVTPALTHLSGPNAYFDTANYLKKYQRNSAVDATKTCHTRRSACFENSVWKRVSQAPIPEQHN